MEFVTDALSHGSELLTDPTNIFLVFAGVIWGLLAGALPGISATIALGSVIGLTFTMDTAGAIIFLVAILVGTQYGNSVPAILIGVPGTSAAVLTAIEGQALHKQGRTGEAMAISLTSSVIGQFFSVILFVVAVVPLSRAAMNFLPQEIFAMTVLGMTSVVALGGKNVFKGLVAVAFGVLVSTVGRDPVTSMTRLTFGSLYLSVGLNIIAVIIGLLAVSELIRTSRQVYSWGERSPEFRTDFPGFGHLRTLWKPITIGTGIGAAIGAIPGAASDIASYVSYQQAKLWSRQRRDFGRGSTEALAAIDSAQNSSIGGQLIPTIGMGIPGGPTMVLVLASLTLHGLLPGPMLLTQSVDVLYAGVAGLLGGTVALALVGWPVAKVLIRLAMVDRPIVIVIALALSVLGVFALNKQLFDVGVTLFFGVVGYFMYRYGYSVAGASLGVVLGGLMERSLRQGLLLSGSLTDMVTRPITGAVLLISVALLVFGIISEYRGRKASRESQGALAATTARPHAEEDHED
jgi:putative tricarboxylic transport membrane protein